MASTNLSFFAYPGQSLTVFLIRESGTGTPDAGGYAAEDTGDPGYYILTEFIDEALDGEFRVRAEDGDNEVAYRGYVRLEDTAQTYRSYQYTETALEASIAGMETKLCAVKASVDALGVEVGRIIKSGELFVASSEYEVDREVRFTRASE